MLETEAVKDIFCITIILSLQDIPARSVHVETMHYIPPS
jgi:hypothetical protein